MYGKSNKEGFTLLEVVVAIVIFAVGISVLLKIQTQHIVRTAENIEKIRALKPLKEHIYNIPVKERDKSYNIDEKRSPYEYNLIKIIYQVKKKDKIILELFEYEFQRE
ncbi:MAG: prepilin-type N-terminal cleavage/methylation domain-containing protein [Aquificae bacterium]|nr:prepilin-type N-terminal cleavage/methylation domain-containing protein [Aquificota bacterium]